MSNKNEIVSVYKDDRGYFTIECCQCQWKITSVSESQGVNYMREQFRIHMLECHPQPKLIKTHSKSIH